MPEIHKLSKQLVGTADKYDGFYCDTGIGIGIAIGTGTGTGFYCDTGTGAGKLVLVLGFIVILVLVLGFIVILSGTNT